MERVKLLRAFRMGQTDVMRLHSFKICRCHPGLSDRCSQSALVLEAIDNGLPERDFSHRQDRLWIPVERLTLWYLAMRGDAKERFILGSIGAASSQIMAVVWYLITVWAWSARWPYLSVHGAT
jgi:hypothetical protein